jgi:hypothetical protein
MLSVKGLTWGTPEFINIAKLGERLYEQWGEVENCEEEDE